MNYRHSHTILWIGLIGGCITGFFSQIAGGVILALAIGQAFLFYRCPHCRCSLLNVAGAPSCCPNCGENLPWR